MTIAAGVAKVVSLKKQTNFTTPASGSGGYAVRRVTSDLSLAKAPYESAELSSTYQRLDVRSGVRSVSGSIEGELSPGSYQLPLAALLHRDFTAVADLTSLTLSVAAPDGNGLQAITRSAGDWMTALKVGMVVRVTAGLAAGSLNQNLLVVALTATVMTVLVLNGTVLSTQSTIAGCTVAIPGKYTYVPETGHTDDTFTIEHWYPDVAQSEVFNGCKFSRASFDLPPTGIAKITLEVMGRNMTDGTSQVLTSPTALTGGVVASVNGALLINGLPQALLTGLQLEIDGEYSAEPVVGSNVYPEIFRGRNIVRGQATVFFQDATVRDLFVDETEVSIVLAMTTGSSGTADFITFTMPKVKFMGASKSDGPKGLVQTMPFDATYISTGGSGAANEKTTLMVHDSRATV